MRGSVVGPALAWRTITKVEARVLLVTPIATAAQLLETQPALLVQLASSI